jgi:cell pole-organizing protein PopZ
MAEASAQKGAAGGEDTSMEEILQSIRSIIAEDGEEGKTGGEKKNPNNPAGEVTGSDVLELTDTMAVDTPPPAAAQPQTPPAAPVMETPAAATPVAAAPTAAAPAASADVLSQIENALATPTAAAAPTAAPGEALLSPEAAALAAGAVKKLQAAVEPPIPGAATTPSPVFMSGNTVEGMAAAMLKPMIKEWLDKNLPAIVERIVTMEIRRLSK